MGDEYFDVDEYYTKIGEDTYYFDSIRGIDYRDTITKLKRIESKPKKAAPPTLEKHIKSLIEGGGEYFEILSSWGSINQENIILRKRHSLDCSIDIAKYQDKGYVIKTTKVCSDGIEIVRAEFNTENELDSYVLKWILEVI